jgi:chromatin structure-remodeling complex subunit RSC4
MENSLLTVSINFLIITCAQAKLKRFDYPTVTTLESDLRRLVSNAKSYNDKSSLIFADAERIRKMVVAAMPGINPAYKDPNYSPFPTPIPSLPSNSDIEAAGSVKAEEDTSEAVSLTRRPPGHPRAVSAPEDNNQSKDDFEGTTLQAAQDKIISELIQLKDSE